MSKVSKEYSVTVGRTTIRNVKPEDQDDYFLVDEGDLNGGRTVIASVHVSPKKSYGTFEHIKTEVSIPSDQSFVSPGVLLDTALAAIEAGEDAHYGVRVIDRKLVLLPRHSDMRTIKQADRTPERLLRVLIENEEDAYIMNILKAAKVLCANGYRDSLYLSHQYMDGITLWEFLNSTLIVHTDGTIIGESDRSSSSDDEDDDDDDE